MTDSVTFDLANMYFYIWLNKYNRPLSKICISHSPVAELYDEYNKDDGSLKPIRIMPDPFHVPSEYGVNKCEMVLCSYDTERQIAIETFAEFADLDPIITFKCIIKLKSLQRDYKTTKRLSVPQQQEYLKTVIQHCRTVMLPIIQVDTDSSHYSKEHFYTFHISGSNVTVADSVIVLAHIAKNIAELMDLEYELANMSVCFSTREMRTSDASVRADLVGKLLTKLINTHDDALTVYNNHHDKYELFSCGDIDSGLLVRIPSHPDRIPFIEDCRISPISNVYKVCDFLLKICASKDEL